MGLSFAENNILVPHSHGSVNCIMSVGAYQTVRNNISVDTKNGLSLLNGPGNDIVAITNLMACGAHMVLFTTGRGTPLGGAVPTVKIASNNNIAAKKPHWIDFSAYGFEKDKIADDLLSIIRDVANGKQTNNEKSGSREIAIFKDGVTL